MRDFADEVQDNTIQFAQVSFFWQGVKNSKSLFSSIKEVYTV